MSAPIRVVVVDDSALMRHVITSLLEQDSTISVVGAAANGREAIAVVEQLRPDVVTMDVRMPVMDGLSATEHLMAYCPTPILVLTASLGRQEVDITFKMLGAGALEVVEKPSVNGAGALDRAAADLIRRVKTLSRVKVVTHLRGRRRPGEPLPQQRPESPPAVVAPSTQRVEERLGAYVPDTPLIVIGASTGGPRVVHRILAALPADLAAAVLVVQHIAPGFSAGMVDWLRHACPLPVRLAAEGQRLNASEVAVAPDRSDLLLTAEGRVHLSATPLLLQRPSIDVAMQAAADVYGSRTIGVLLTGMGRDGAYGMLRIKRAGGHTIAQDEASCAIFGMPRAAISLGAAAEVLPPPQIAERLTALVGELRGLEPRGERP